MEAKTILPQLNLIPIKIGNQTHEFYTDIDVESVRAFTAIWLLENKGTEESDYNLSSLLQYIKKNDPNSIVLSKKQYNIFVKNLRKYELY